MMHMFLNAFKPDADITLVTVDPDRDDRAYLDRERARVITEMGEKWVFHSSHTIDLRKKRNGKQTKRR